MPRKTEKPPVQKGGTGLTSDVAVNEQETPPRRSARTAARGDASSVANRSRRSSTAAQTAASVAESRVTRSSRSSTGQQRSTSPQENVRTRSSRETSESPASRVKATRRSTGRVNYQESEGEEDASATTERNEEEYLVEDDAEESDSEESSRSRNKTRTVSKSPPKIRGRGRGRTTKGAGRGRGKSMQFEQPSDKENDKIPGSDTTDVLTSPRTRRQQKEAEPVVEKGRRTRGSSSQKEQTEAVPVRSSKRGEKKTKIDTEGESVPLSKPRAARSTRGRQSVTEEMVTREEEKVAEQKEAAAAEEQEEEKRKRKLKTTDEPSKRQKLDKPTVESENTNEPDNLGSDLAEESMNLEKSTETDMKDVTEEDVSKVSDASELKDELVPEEPVPTEPTSKEIVSSEQQERDKEKEELMEVEDVDILSQQRVSDDKTTTEINKQEEKMECEEGSIEEEDIDNSVRNIAENENTQRTETTCEKAETYSKEVTEDIPTVGEQEQEKDIVKESIEDMKEHVSSDEVKAATKEHEMDTASTETAELVVSVPPEKTAIDDTAPANESVDTENSSCLREHELSKEQESTVSTSPQQEKELSTQSTSLPLSDSGFQCPSAQAAEVSSPQEIDPRPLGSSEANFRENSIVHCAHESNKAARESNNSVGGGFSDIFSVNGADPVEKSMENAIDMSKGSDDSSLETQRIASEPSLHTATVTVLECATTKANGAHHNITTSTEPPPFTLLNRRYIINPSLSEDARSRLKSTTFSLISFNMGAMRNESAYAEKLGLEIRRKEADIICLQEIKMTFYSESLEQIMNNFGYKGLLSIPESYNRGLCIFYNTNTFNLIRHAGIPLQKVIDQDLEMSSLENNDKAAVRDFLQKCGHMLVAQLKSVIADRTLTIANVLFPPCDIGTHALQMSSSVREVVSFLDDIARPHVICGAFNMPEGGVAYQLLREGYLNNEMIEELQQRKDVRLPGKENDTLVNLLWKAFQHPSSNLRSCYAAAMGHELRLGHEKSITSPDLLWYSSDSLETLGVLDIGPAGESLEHVALKADIAYVC